SLILKAGAGRPISTFGGSAAGMATGTAATSRAASRRVTGHLGGVVGMGTGQGIEPTRDRRRVPGKYRLQGKASNVVSGPADQRDLDGRGRARRAERS